MRRALEFWPLLGDAASPEQGGSSRLVDASTARVELRLRPEAGDESDWHDWQVFAEGVRPAHAAGARRAGALKVFGLRYRSFVPGWGLHPALGAQAPVRLLLRHPGHAADYLVTLHEWRPDGEAYAGLPEDLAAASQRRADRVTLEVAAPRPSLRPTFCACTRSQPLLPGSALPVRLTVRAMSGVDLVVLHAGASNSRRTALKHD